MSVSVNVDLSEFNKSMQALSKKFANKGPLIKEALTFTAEWVLGEAQKVVPKDQGTLARSATVEQISNGVEFGFNTRYAAAQDLGFPSMRLRPKRKKWLYVPISDRGRRYHTYGRNPADEGLKYGTDYVLKKYVDIRNKPYGFDKGPNKYFSGTLEKNKTTIFEVLIKRLKERLDDNSANELQKYLDSK